MNLSTVANILWGNQARSRYLLFAAAVLLFTLLGGREIWTQEHRWADIVSGMFYRHDFFHPYLGENTYYDKPLLSYWLIALFAKLTGELTAGILRLPSALAGFLAIFAIYRLGALLKDKQLGLLAGWLLLTTFYFVFWARTSSADMLNLAGALFAVYWYFEKKSRANFFTYVIFFLILALTALCKGLVGAIIPLMVIFADVVLQKSWRKYINWPLLLAIIPALLLYLFPFIASSYYGGESTHQSGLYLVYRENVLRYFQPFDHKGPLYTYFIYLPIYIFPWVFFFVPALMALPSRWKSMSLNSKWITWSLLLLFLFFTSSGSRRSYYILPVIPFAILFIADWILSEAAYFPKRCAQTAGLIILSFVLLIFIWIVVEPWYYAQYGVNQFAVTLKKEASKIKPWPMWNVVMLDAESKLSFYLQLPPTMKNYGVVGKREKQTIADLMQAWPVLKNKPEHTIFVSRKLYAPYLQKFFSGYQLIEGQIPFFNHASANVPIAFIPEK